MMKHTYFMAVIDSEFCLNAHSICKCEKLTVITFESSEIMVIGHA